MSNFDPKSVTVQRTVKTDEKRDHTFMVTKGNHCAIVFVEVETANKAAAITKLNELEELSVGYGEHFWSPITAEEGCTPQFYVKGVSIIDRNTPEP